MIGAETLSEAAKNLEAAGKDDNITFIKSNHQKTMGMYKEVIAEINAYFAAISGENK